MSTIARLRAVHRTLLALLVVLALALVAGACGDDEDEGGGGGTEPSAPAQTQEQASGCRDVASPEPKPDGGQRRPTRKLAAGKTYEVTFETSCGAFTFELDQKT